MKNGRWEDKYGNVRWFKDDKLHRTDGPVIERVDGTKEWYQNGKLHRTDGPAVQFSDDTEYWFILGHFICETKKPAIDDK